MLDAELDSLVARPARPRSSRAAPGPASRSTETWYGAGVRPSGSGACSSGREPVSASNASWTRAGQVAHRHRPARAQVVGAGRQRALGAHAAATTSAHVGQRDEVAPLHAGRAQLQRPRGRRPGGRGRWPRASSGRPAGARAPPSSWSGAGSPPRFRRPRARHQVLGGQAGDGVRGAWARAGGPRSGWPRAPSGGRTRARSTCRRSRRTPAPDSASTRRSVASTVPPSAAAGARAATTSFSPARWTTTSAPSHASAAAPASLTEVADHLLHVQVRHRLADQRAHVPALGPEGADQAAAHVPARAGDQDRRHQRRVQAFAQRRQAGIPVERARRSRGTRRRSPARRASARARTQRVARGPRRRRARTARRSRRASTSSWGAPCGGGHDRRAAGQRLDQHHPERVVARRQAGQPTPARSARAGDRPRPGRAAWCAATASAGACASRRSASPGPLSQSSTSGSARATSGSASSSSGTSLCEPSSAPENRIVGCSARARRGHEVVERHAAGHDHPVAAAVLALQVVEPAAGHAAVHVDPAHDLLHRARVPPAPRGPVGARRAAPDR